MNHQLDEETLEDLAKDRDITLKWTDIMQEIEEESARYLRKRRINQYSISRTQE